MARYFTARMANALANGAPRVILAEIDHPAGTFRAWTGIGTLSHNGYNWTGLGILGSIAPVKATTDLSIQELNFSLSGVDPESLALIEGSVRNRTATVWLACLDERGNVVADPFQLLEALLDYQQFKVDESGSATVSIIARTGFYTLERSLNEVWSPENQKRLFPNDTGLDLLPSLEKKDTNWTVS